MITTIKKVAVSIAACTIIAMPAFAGPGGQPLVLSEVDSCIAEVMNRIDTTGVTRVRHLVTDYGHSSRGVKLTIETSIFTPDSQTTYSVYCVAKGENAPSKFRLKELNG